MSVTQDNIIYVKREAAVRNVIFQIWQGVIHKYERIKRVIMKAKEDNAD